MTLHSIFERITRFPSREDTDLKWWQQYDNSFSALHLSWVCKVNFHTLKYIFNNVWQVSDIYFGCLGVTCFSFLKLLCYLNNRNRVPNLVSHSWFICTKFILNFDIYLWIQRPCSTNFLLWIKFVVIIQILKNSCSKNALRTFVKLVAHFTQIFS